MKTKIKDVIGSTDTTACYNNQTEGDIVTPEKRVNQPRKKPTARMSDRHRVLNNGLVAMAMRNPWDVPFGVMGGPVALKTETRVDTTKKEHNDKPTTYKCKHCVAKPHGNHTDEKNNMVFDNFEEFLSIEPSEATKRRWMLIMNDRMFNQEHPNPLGSRVPTESIRTNQRLLQEMITAGMSEHVCMIPLVDAPMKEPQPVENKSTPVKKKPATEQTMAKIRCDRIMIDDVKMIKIKEFIGFLRMDDLPDEYVSGRPMVGLEEDTITEYLLIQPTNDVLDSTVLRINDNITYKRYVELLQIMSAAGQRLTDVNAKAKRARAFSGEFTVTI